MKMKKKVEEEEVFVFVVTSRIPENLLCPAGDLFLIC